MASKNTDQIKACRFCGATEDLYEAPGLGIECGDCREGQEELAAMQADGHTCVDPMNRATGFQPRCARCEEEQN